MPHVSVDRLRQRIRGMIPPLCTMRTAGGELLLDAQTEFYDLVAPSSDVLFVSGTTGLCPWLSLEERKTLTRHALSYAEQKGQDKPVICAALGNTAEQTAEQARELAAAGADAVVVYTPYFFRHPEEELLAFFCDLASQADGIGLILYNLPQMTKNDITPALAAKICEATESYVAIKDSKGDVEQFRQLLALKDRMNILAGDEEVATHVLGDTDGCVPAAGNVFPLLWRTIMNQADDPEALERFRPDILAVKRDLYGLPDMPQVISGVLTALAMLGIGNGPTRPFLDVDQLEAASGLRQSVTTILQRLREFVPEPFRSRIP